MHAIERAGEAKQPAKRRPAGIQLCEPERHAELPRRRDDQAGMLRQGVVDPRLFRFRHTTSMNTPERDGAAVRFPPPFVYLIAVIVGGLLHALVLPWPLGIPLFPRICIAAAAALAGVAIVANAIGLFRRTGQDPKPWESTPEIISAGIYRFTRNPMYVGMALIQLSIGLALGNLWILAFIPLVLAIVYATAIRHEEAYLERKFGATYLAYKKSVRRWL